MSDYPVPTHFLLHISDTHFVEDGALLHGSVDSDANLRELFEGFARSNAVPEAIIFTGDLADAGQPEAYRRLRAMVEPVVRDYGAELIWVMGNHDERGAFRAGLLDEPPTTENIDRVVDVHGLRIIAIDSTVAGQHYGEIDQEQLDWLAAELATPAPHGTLLAMHHPPVPSPIGLVRLVELREQDRLARVIEHSDVRGILAGHLHYSTQSTFAGVPVSVASATCYTQDLNVRFPASRGQNGAQSFDLVHVYADRIMHSVVPIGSFPTVYEVTEEQMRSFAELDGAEQLELVASSLVGG